jgi:predicted GTPase
MENRTANITRLDFTICSVDANTDIDDNEFVYMDGRSLKIVPFETTYIYEIQESLREKLHESHFLLLSS